MRIYRHQNHETDESYHPCFLSRHAHRSVPFDKSLGRIKMTITLGDDPVTGRPSLVDQKMNATGGDQTEGEPFDNN